MGGVDVFDQLRLQRYSVQLAHRFKKYYKSLALGLLDCALVNAFVVHREHNRRLGKSGLDHGELLMASQRHLVQCTQSNFMSQRADPVVDEGYRVVSSQRVTVNDGHLMSLTNDFIEATDSQPRKRMTRVCKVCSIVAHGGGKRSYTSTFCGLCSRNFRGDVYLCAKARHPKFGATKTCFQIWHQDWQGGKCLPPGADQLIRFRPPTGKTRKTRNAVEHE